MCFHIYGLRLFYSAVMKITRSISMLSIISTIVGTLNKKRKRLFHLWFRDCLLPLLTQWPLMFQREKASPNKWLQSLFGRINDTKIFYCTKNYKCSCVWFSLIHVWSLYYVSDNSPRSQFCLLSFFTSEHLQHRKFKLEVQLASKMRVWPLGKSIITVWSGNGTDRENVRF